MEPIFQHCEGWENCDHEDLRNLFEGREIRGDEFELPDEHELDRLNDKCRECNHVLEIRDQQCPLCLGKDFQSPKFPLPSEFEAASTTRYFYECTDCKRLLFTHEKL